MLIFLAALVGVQQCHSFKQSILATLELERKMCCLSHCYLPNKNCCQRCFNSAKQPLYSIRGGSVDEKTKYDETTDSFISSFESELSQIRREISLEAENEIQKLRGLIERMDDMEEDDEMNPKHDEKIDGSSENDNVEVTIAVNDDEPTENSGTVTEEKPHLGEWDAEAFDQSEMGIQNELRKLHQLNEQSVVVDEKDEMDLRCHESIDGPTNNDILEAITDGDDDKPTENDMTGSGEGTLEKLSDEEESRTLDQSEIEIDEVLPNYDIAAGIGQSEIESDKTDDIVEESITVEVENDLRQFESKFTAEPNDVSYSAKSDNDTSLDDSKDTKAHVNERITPKKSKKKRKLSKKARKAIIHLSHESDLSDECQLEMGKSIVLTSTQEETAQQHHSGIMFYLKSDLARALVLFVATIMVTIFLQRLQHQMEAEGI
eukprot:CAMPEP_0172579374 /NCGR_PEP_ID=MMETSP1067-20121228/139215_1 /TAXON_ID=265564 ORGANISM="Thalassiosira punctigera, Strain Tpunct2005C2" /NCGR_SAMPLE_ID=MMETSP1067 /ASSEMBLY_ACC=CAM_ASM_000444 /LENGTH=432 /DNA_ID=CAMNT_0013372093 /DNA_START=115 /DNA_END=1413 /DNA_ORIENTATION=+